ncbi:T Cell Receptor Alpha Variable 8-3 [Manis pentadactyla]|nr:T Cell Receptor Alpha Variable 8-3 [Manis pentadactyla]
MIFALRVARAQQVTQPEVHVYVPEGAPLELRCNYSYGGILYLFWYVQYPSQGLQLLLRQSGPKDTRDSKNELVSGINDCAILNVWTKQWKLGEPGKRTSDLLGKGFPDYELHLFSHRVPHSFLGLVSVAAFLLLRGDPPERSQQCSDSSAMLPLLISALRMMFALRVARAQQVTQPEVHVSVPEGAPLELRCNYSYGGTPYLFWYVQYPSQGLQLLLR